MDEVKYMYGYRGYDVSHDSEGIIASTIDRLIDEYYELRTEPPKYVVMNRKAYTMLCSYLSDIAGLDDVTFVNNYKGLDVIVIAFDVNINNIGKPFIYEVTGIHGLKDFYCERKGFNDQL